MQKLKVLTISIIVVMLLSLAGLSYGVSAHPLAASSPSLGDAESFSVLGGETVTNTGPTTMSGNLGVSPGSAITGFPPGTVGGEIQRLQSAAAQIANTAAFGYLDQECTTPYPGTKDLVGEKLGPGVYCADAFSLTGTLTLVGSGVWIFKSAATLITSGTANIVGGDPCNVWWRVVSSATLGTNTSLIGSILASTSISLKTGARLNGRALAKTGSVTLESNIITLSCAAAPTAVPPTAPENTLPTATSLPGLPPAGGAPIQNEGFPWSLVVIGGFSIVALVLGVRTYRRTYRPR